MTRNATIQEFADELHIGYKTAYCMARSELFLRLKISVEVGHKWPGKKKAMRRIDLQKYYEARDRGQV